MSNNSQRATITIRAAIADSGALDEIATEIVGANRHAVGVAALRLGIEALRREPARAMEYLADQRCAPRLRLRGQASGVRS